VGEGVTHYYGVGAYRRPVEDVRLANVKFTPECLGFSNVPEPSNLRALTPDGSVAPHHPAWKSGVPRDSGAGWDFEDVRDHYFEVIHGVGAVSMRSDDPDHYMRLARTVTGRVMERVFDEWRSPESACGGALVWFLKDLRPGAGWGIIDSDGNPKAAYYFLKRAWAPLRISVLDRGLDGLRIELHNEGAEPVAGHMTVKVIASTSATVAEAGRQVTVPARDTLAVSGEELLGHFADSTNAYRFGPPRHAAIEVSFHAAGHPQPIRTVYWPSMSSPLMPVQLTGTVDTGGRAGSAQSTGLTRDVRIELKGAVPSQNYFDLAPGVDARFVYRVEADTATTRGFLDAPNAPEGSRFKVCE
jgi:beta-mannosidase